MQLVGRLTFNTLMLFKKDKPCYQVTVWIQMFQVKKKRKGFLLPVNYFPYIWFGIRAL